MAPTHEAVRTEAVSPIWTAEHQSGGVAEGSVPVREFMLRQTRRRTWRSSSNSPAPRPESRPTAATGGDAGFMISELKTAFEIGFISICRFSHRPRDRVRAQSMGMVMLPPAIDLAAVPRSCALSVWTMEPDRALAVPDSVETAPAAEFRPRAAAAEPRQPGRAARIGGRMNAHDCRGPIPEKPSGRPCSCPRYAPLSAHRGSDRVIFQAVTQSRR